MAAKNMYTDLLAVMENLPALMREKRRLDGASLRDVSLATGLPESSLCKFEKEPDYGMAYQRATEVIRWLGSHE